MTANAANSPPPTSLTPKLAGFDAEFSSLQHYIRVITDRIWESRQIDDIYRYYSDPCTVETASTVSTSIADILDGTRATLAMFPDRRLLAEDVIQSGDAKGGFLSSHRIISTMTHLGDGSFGKPTGRRLHVRTIADCVCRDNRIIHEWLVRDHAAIALQIGSTPQALARRWLNERGGWHKPQAGAAPSGYVSHLSDDVLAVGYASHVEDFVCGRGRVANAYDDAAQQIGPGELTCYGHREIEEFWTRAFSDFQVKAFAVEHLAVQRDHLEPSDSRRADRVAMRFRAQTVHEGRAPTPGHFGASTGQSVEILGILHAEFWRGRIIREWVLIDEVALWMQIFDSSA